MRKVLDSQHFFIANIIFSVVIATSIFYISEDYPLSALLFFAPLFTHLSAITLLPLKQGKPRKDDIITGVTFLSSWFLPLLCYLFVPTVGIFSLLLVFIIVAVGGFLSHRERPFEFDSQTSKRHKDFELYFWNQLIIEQTLEPGKVILNKEINNRKGITLTDIETVTTALMRRSPEAIQNVLDFIELPIEEKEMAILPQSVRKPLPFESALLFLAPTVYEVIKTFVNDWLANVISELENCLKSNYFKLIIILFLMLGLLIISLIFILAIVRRFSKETKRKQVKQILPKLLKDVLEEKQSQHYHSRQFPKRWTK